MYARTLTQQPNNPPTQPSEVKACSLFFTFWPWFWCTCLRRDEFLSFKFCSIFYKISFVFAWFSRDFASIWIQISYSYFHAIAFAKMIFRASISALEPSRKFGLGDAITFGVTIFRASISARISTKNHRFRRAFWCNSLRRVDFFVVPFLNEFRQKKHRF